LVKPADSGYVKIGNSDTYIRYFQVIATPDDFEIYPAGYSRNAYDEQIYAFSISKDFDVSQYFDNFGFPLTELFLFPCYIKKLTVMVLMRLCQGRHGILMVYR